jgi:hypothetical protein
VGGNRSYVGLFASLGFIALCTVVFSHIRPELVNPLVIVFLYLYLYYGTIVIIIKHYKYYTLDPEAYAVKEVPGGAAGFFKYYAPAFGVLFLIVFIAMGQIGNGLHVLHPVDEKDPVELEKYLAKLDTNLSNPDRPMYLFASYGGGIRAQTWTMLLLNEIEQRDPNPLETTLAMSGVSGGFLGLSMYTAIRSEHPNAEARDRAISRIGTRNIVSIDMAYLLGFDFIRELLPIDSFCCRDRAGRSMQTYAALIQEEAKLRTPLLDSTFRNYWGRAYRESTQFVPALIGNTTGTHGRYGVAFSVGHGDKFSRIFPGADNILDAEPGKSLKYLDATSTTERFPIFSPTAQVEKLGHFLDGGYFENSGLLSLGNFYDYVVDLDKNLDTTGAEIPAKIVLIINSREAYARHVINGEMAKKTDDIATGELPAILSTVGSIGILPSALEEQFHEKFGENFIRIYLPYPLHYEDIVSEIRGTPADPLAIMKAINSSNAAIDTALTRAVKAGAIRDPWGEVYPPLARLLGDPAFEYTKAMLWHDEVVEALGRLE